MKNNDEFDISDEFTKSLEKLVEEETNVAKAYVEQSGSEKSEIDDSEAEAPDMGHTQMFNSDELKKSVGAIDIGDLVDDEEPDTESVTGNVAGASRKVSTQSIQNRTIARSVEKRADTRKNTFIIIGMCVVVLVAVVGIIAGAIAMSNKNKNSYEYNMEQAKGYYESQDYGTALNFYVVAYDTSEGQRDTDLMYKMYECYMGIGDTVMAKDMLDDMIAYDKYNELAINALGKHYRNNNNAAGINSLLAEYRGTRAEEYIKEFEVAVPTPSETPGEFSSSIKLSLMAGSGCKIYYTVDGSQPTTGSTLYSGELHIDKDVVVKAIAVDSIGVESLVAEFAYTISYDVPDGPVLSVATGSTIDTDTVIKVTNIKGGDSVYYTVDGTTPTANSTKYNDGIKLDKGSCIISLVTISENGEASKITRYTYVVNEVKIYTYEESVRILKERMIGLNILQDNGLYTTGGDRVSFLYETKTDINENEMYIIKYVVNSTEKTEGYYGVSTKGGSCYKVTVTDGKYSAVKY